jgi:hypothetical protein
MLETITYDKKMGVLAGIPPNYAIRLTKLPQMHRGEELAKLIPERVTHIFALHPDNWEYTYYSLTGKDKDKIRFYGPVAIMITPDTLIAEMNHATAFMYSRNVKDADKYKESLKLLSQVNVREYKRPELLIPCFQCPHVYHFVTENK